MSQDSLSENGSLLADKFKDEIGTVSWSWLRPHEKRKTLFRVAPELDLVEVAIAVAEDKATQVKVWLDRGDLEQPALEKVARWERDGGLFLGVIVKPYVFFQEAGE